MDAQEGLSASLSKVTGAPPEPTHALPSRLENFLPPFKGSIKTSSLPLSGPPKLTKVFGRRMKTASH